MSPIYRTMENPCPSKDDPADRRCAPDRIPQTGKSSARLSGLNRMGKQEGFLSGDNNRRAGKESKDKIE
jgi:hypothetical protein